MTCELFVEEMSDFQVKWGILVAKMFDLGVKWGIFQEKVHDILVKWWIFEEKMCDFGLHVSFLSRKCVIFRLNGGLL